MTKQSCPHNEQLASFVRCELSEDVAAGVLDHLDSCPHCEETVAKLELTLRSVLPGAAPTLINLPYSDESACHRAVKALVDEFASPPAHESCVPQSIELDRLAESVEVQTVRDFRILEKVGQGGMGAVYKAVHQRMQRTVALKVLPSGLISDQSAIARFNREMAVLGQLNHPHIVQAFDAGDHEGQHYLAMEFIDGQDVATVLRRSKRLSIANACLIASQVASALQYAHEKGFVHRDIKPSNLMLANITDQNGNPQAIVKVLDLGLARVFEHSNSDNNTESADLTSAGQIMGTLDYMAPEQGSDSHGVDIRTDIYSLGATLYKLLTGEVPFAEHAGRAPMQRLMAIATQEIRSVTLRRPDVPEKLAKVVHRMLEKDPSRRFQTPAEVARALEEFTSGACLIELLQPGTGGSNDSNRFLPSFESRSDSGSRHGRVKRFLQAVGGFAAFSIMAALLVINTRHGRIEVTSPDGKLPADLRVVVLKGGEEVQILQAENQWTASIVNGEYEVAVEGGDHQFEIKDSKLVVSRMGKAVCIVTHSPAPHSGNKPANEIAPEARPEKPLSEVAAGNARDLAGPLAMNSVLLADRDKPFVIRNEKGEQIAEFRFANEAFAARHSGVIEVHGNGPFKLGQVRREGGSLHIKAGAGYRPQFDVGFDLPDNNNTVNWFELAQVDFSVDGCNFTGAVADQFMVFSGTGNTWKFRNCQLTQPYTRVGGVVRFDGQSFDAAHCQFFTPSPTCMLIDVKNTVSTRLANNRFLRGGYAVAVHSRGAQTAKLESNLFYGNRMLVVARDPMSTDPVKVEALENEFVCSSGLIGADAVTDPKTLLSWNGVHNRLVPATPELLWGGRNPDEPKVLETIADWNRYWGNPVDLETGEAKSYPWDVLNTHDISAARQRITTEVEDARLKFSELATLGPDMKLVGPGEAWKNALRSIESSDSAIRPDSLEGGPFVIVRDKAPIAGYISFAVALEHTQNGDTIEIRSDGPFPEIHIGHAVEKQLTLRAAAGYHPVFDNFNADEKSGDWTLEGLHFRGTGSKPALWCAARRIANCSIDYAAIDGRTHLRCPRNADGVEIANCFLSNHTEVISVATKITNSILTTVATHLPESLPDSTECSINVERCCLWTHTTPNLPNAGTAISTSGKQRLQISDSLIDAAHVTYGSTTIWSGERNLYRTYGPYESNPVTDEGSVKDDSVFLRPERWQQ